jgi:hypothetical protein
MSLQLPAILSPPTLCIPSSTLTVSPHEEVAEVALPFTGRRPVLGFALPYAGSPMHLAVSCSTLFCLWTGSSSQVASHPVLRRRSFLRLRTTSVLSDGDFHPTVGAHSQAHARDALPRVRRGMSGNLRLWIGHRVGCATSPISLARRPQTSQSCKGAMNIQR